MSKEKIKEIILTEENNSRIFNVYFLPALKNRRIYSSGNYIIMDNGSEKIKVLSAMFLLFYKESFKYIFETELPTKAISAKILNDEVTVNLFYYSNSVFDSLLGVRALKADFYFDLYNELQRNKTKRESSRQTVIRAIQGLPEEIREDYIKFFTEMNILLPIDKPQLGYYDRCTADQLQSYKKKGELTDNKIRIIIDRIIEKEREKNDSNTHDNKYFRKIVACVNMLEPVEILQRYCNGQITVEDLDKTKARKEDLFLLSLEDLLPLLRGEKKLPKRFEITSKDIINNYGKTINGMHLAIFISEGLVNSEDVIDVASINEALSHTDYDQDLVYDNDEIKDYYSPLRLILMYENKKLTPEFVKKYLDFMNFKNNLQLFDKKSDLLVEEIKNFIARKELSEDEKLNQVREYIFNFYNLGLCNAQKAKENIPANFIENKYLNGDCSIEEIDRFHQNGLIDDVSFSRYHSDEEILDFYYQGKVSVSALRSIRNKNLLEEAYFDHKIRVSDIMQLYFWNTINIDDVQTVAELEVEANIDFSVFIDRNTPFEKVKELFMNSIIDYSALLRLKSNGYVTEEQFVEAKKALDTNSLYRDLESGRTFHVVTTRKNESSGIKKKRNGGVKEEIDFSDEISLFSKILGKDLNKIKPALIESINANGNTTTLNNYEIYGSQELDLVVLRKSEVGNAIFIMTGEQLHYFLSMKKEENGQEQIVDRMRDKAFLKTIDGVVVLHHSRFFARNAIEASCRLSEKVSEQIKGQDGQYKEDVLQMVEKMQKDYEAKHSQTREKPEEILLTD